MRTRWQLSARPLNPPACVAAGPGTPRPAAQVHADGAGPPRRRCPGAGLRACQAAVATCTRAAGRRYSVPPPRSSASTTRPPAAPARAQLSGAHVQRIARSTCMDASPPRARSARPARQPVCMERAAGSRPQPCALCGTTGKKSSGRRLVRDLSGADGVVPRRNNAAVESPRRLA